MSCSESFDSRQVRASRRGDGLAACDPDDPGRRASIKLTWDATIARPGISDPHGASGRLIAVTVIVCEQVCVIEHPA